MASGEKETSSPLICQAVPVKEQQEYKALLQNNTHCVTKAFSGCVLHQCRASDGTPVLTIGLGF